MRWRRKKLPNVECIELFADDVLCVHVDREITREEAHVLEERVASAFSDLCFHDVLVLGPGMRFTRVSGEHV